MSLCENCVKGVTHEGTPKGKWEKIGGVCCHTHWRLPSEQSHPFLTDVFGPQIIKSASSPMVANGFKTIVPDHLNGDPVPVEALSPGRDTAAEIVGWFPNHPQEKTRPTLDKVLRALKNTGITELAATGYCFGGRYTFDLAYEDIIKVAVVAHPILIKVPEDLEKYAATSKAPLLINSCSDDTLFPIEASVKADEILGSGKFAPGYKREYFVGCTHGFASRGDLSDPIVKAGKEGAFKGTVEWIKKYI